MKFTNISEDTLDVPALDLYGIKPGEETPDLADAQALGFMHQPERWQPDHPRTARRLIKEEAARHEPVEEEPVVEAEPVTEQGAAE